MKRFMVMVLCEGEQTAMFYDSYEEASGCRMDLECGLGAYCEIYERVEIEDGLKVYDFLEA